MFFLYSFIHFNISHINIDSSTCDITFSMMLNVIHIFFNVIVISKIANVCVTAAHKILRMQMSTAIKTNKSKEKEREREGEKKRKTLKTYRCIGFGYACDDKSICIGTIIFLTWHTNTLTHSFVRLLTHLTFPLSGYCIQLRGELQQQIWIKCILNRWLRCEQRQSNFSQILFYDRTDCLRLFSNNNININFKSVTSPT